MQTGRGEVDDNERPFYIESVRQVNTKKFKTKAMNYRVQFTNALADAEISSLHGRLHEIFQQILDETIGGVPPQDQVRFVLHSNQLEYPINFPFMAPNRLITERILAEFERVIQSNKEFWLNDTVEINVIHVSMPMGGRGTKRSEVNLEKHLDKKKSIIRIRNDDELCMARALVVAKAKLDNDPRDRHIRMSNRPLQARLARELHQNANVPLGPCGIEQAKLFQTYLSEYQISIVCKEYGDKIIYAGPEKDKRIYLYMHSNHYDVITKMPGFFARSYYCHTCKKAYEHLEEHRCLNACKCCRFPTECSEVSWLTCPDCHRLFRSQQCFEQHKQTRGNARSVCERLIRCTKCQETVRRCKQKPEKHRCGLTKCWIGGKYVQLEGHRCYIQPETKKKRKPISEEREEEEMPETGMTWRPSSIRNVDRANGKSRMNRLKNRCKTCYFSTLNPGKKTETTSLIYALYRTRPARNGFSRAIRPETSFANGCSQGNTRGVRSWLTTFKVTTAISFCSIYASKALNTMSLCVVLKF